MRPDRTAGTVGDDLAGAVDRPVQLDPIAIGIVHDQRARMAARRILPPRLYAVGVETPLEQLELVLLELQAEVVEPGAAVPQLERVVPASPSEPQDVPREALVEREPDHPLVEGGGDAGARRAKRDVGEAGVHVSSAVVLESEQRFV